MKPAISVLVMLFLGTALIAEQRPLGIDPQWDGITNPHAELKKIGDTFSFGVNADPQVEHYDAKTELYNNCNHNISATIDQLNQRNPRIDFLVYLGDIVNVPEPESFDNFKTRNSAFEGLTIITHGNHDTHPPYTLFRDYQEQINGVRSVYYSFDVGKWHFITLPANIEFGNHANLEVAKPMLQWLKDDLSKNKDRPTMVFIHIHLMPLGLTQLEWYTHTAPLKKELITTLSTYGNVKYVLNGHVHNGIKVSMKTACIYKGITFLTLPSGTAPRPFGEEFPEFSEGLQKGGYYTIFDIKDEKVRIASRNVYSDAEFVYPDGFPEFKEEMEPRLFVGILDLPSKPTLENGSFENGLDGWLKPYRYNCEGMETGYLNEWRMKHKRHKQYSAYVYAKPLGSSWLQDEYNEFYQIVDAPSGDFPVFRGSYLLEDEIEQGGGYYRLIAISGPKEKGEFKFLMEFDFTKPEHEYNYDYYPRAMGYMITGEVSSWLYFQQIASQKKGLFIKVPATVGRWQDIQANIADIYDTAVEQPGAYKKLGITRFVVAGGVVCIKDVKRGMGSFLDAISLESGNNKLLSTINGEPLKVDNSVFETKAGQWQQDAMDKRRRH